MTRLWALITVGLGLAVLGGCGGSSEDEESFAPPAAEYPALMQACLAAEGWTVTIEDGGIAASFPDDQEEAYETARSKCVESTGFDLPPRPLTDGQMDTLVVQILDAAACVAAEGYDVQQPPSEGALRDALASGNSIDYDPYKLVPEAKLQAVLAACPQPG